LIIVLESSFMFKKTDFFIFFYSSLQY